MEYIVILYITGCSKSSTNIDEYLKSGEHIDSYAKNVMPDISKLPKYKNIEYRYNNQSKILINSDAMLLVVQYDDETYKNEKVKLASNYKFLDKKVLLEGSDDTYTIPEYEFSINSYNFKIVDENNKKGLGYPKSFGMIATSDEKKSIAYLYFYDSDLDYIGKKDEKDSMTNFVKSNFKYDF